MINAKKNKCHFRHKCLDIDSTLYFIHLHYAYTTTTSTRTSIITDFFSLKQQQFFLQRARHFQMSIKDVIKIFNFFARTYFFANLYDKSRGHRNISAFFKVTLLKIKSWAWYFMRERKVRKCVVSRHRIKASIM